MPNKTKKKAIKEEAAEIIHAVADVVGGITPEQIVADIVKHEAEPVIPEGKVLVNSEALQTIMQKLDLLESQNKTFKTELEAVADKAKLDRYRDSIAPKGGAMVRINMLDDKVIVGWTKMPVNICEKNATGHYFEEQQRVLLMEDGTEQRGAYSEFNKHITQMDATVIGRKTMTTDIGEQEILTLAAENGKEYEIDKRFIN
ncbi:MAG: hypothetical protein V1850_03430 [Candidatus Bathyarchaeota archaeon]